MTSAETVSVLNAMRATFAGACVSVSVQVDANTTVTADGIRSNTTIARAISRGGLSNNVDVGVWVPASAFDGVDVVSLPGKTATITDAEGVATTGRLLPVRKHALGGLLNLAIGEYDRVIQ